jgi:hypothetical protein
MASESVVTTTRSRPSTPYQRDENPYSQDYRILRRGSSFWSTTFLQRNLNCADTTTLNRLILCVLRGRKKIVSAPPEEDGKLFIHVDLPIESKKFQISSRGNAEPEPGRNNDPDLPLPDASGHTI